MSREGSAGTIDSRRSPSPSKKSKLTPEEVSTAFEADRVGADTGQRRHCV